MISKLKIPHKPFAIQKKLRLKNFISSIYDKVIENKTKE